MNGPNGSAGRGPPAFSFPGARTRMSNYRSAGRRLRLESLEGRAVPAAIAGCDPTAIDPTVPAQTGTDTSSADPVVVINTGATNPDPGTVTTTSAADGTPQAP